jgi:transcription termination factor NusA
MQNQNAKSIELVISRKNALADLARRGITTLEQLAALSVEEIQSVTGIGEKTAPQVKALARAYLEERAIRFGDLPPEVQDGGSFLDIRVDPDTKPQQPWGFGLMTPDGEKHRLLVIADVLPSRLNMGDGRTIGLMADTRLAWKYIADAADEQHCPVYYWSKNILRHVSETAPKDSRHQLLTWMVDLSRVFLSVAAVPAKRDGLHDVATYLGYNAWGRDYEPYKAHLDYLYWMRNSQRTDLLKSAVDYLDRSVEGVMYIWRWLIDGEV